MKKPSMSAATNEKKRFKPKSIKQSFVGSTLEYISAPDSKTNGEAQDMCFRLNGELMTLPQNAEEEKLMDKTLWDYITKKVENNISEIVDTGKIIGVWTAAESKVVEDKVGESSNFREQTYPIQGKHEFFHPWTGSPLKLFRDAFVLPQSSTIYKFTKMCPRCFNSMKKPIKGNWLNDRLDAICMVELCSYISTHSFICVFSTDPTFTVRGLCKDSVMDTQYKLADHVPAASVDELDSDYMSYIGPKGWIISRNKTDKRWRMSHYHYTDLTLTMLDQDSLPVGRHKWRVENNVCNEGETNSEILQLSGCEEGQFTCDDGKCLDISQRCNSIEVRLF